MDRRSAILSIGSIFAATSCLHAQLPEASPPTVEPKLTVEEILRRTRSGISEDLIIAAIKKNGRAFDLNTDEILDLKKYGVTDTVIKYMLDPSQVYAPTPPPSPASTKPEKKFPPDSIASRIPADPGLYVVNSGAPVAIDLKVLLGSEEPKSLLKKKGKSLAYLLGPWAKKRLTNPLPPFYLRIPEGKQIEELLLLSFTANHGRRELSIGPAGPKQQYSPGDIRPFESLEVGAKLYRITAPKLTDGEYLFLFIGSADASKGIFGKGYDFGVGEPAPLEKKAGKKKKKAA